VKIKVNFVEVMVLMLHIYQMVIFSKSIWQLFCFSSEVYGSQSYL